MVVTQLVEWSLPIPEVCSLSPVIVKYFIEQCLLSTVLKRRKLRKRGREWPILKNFYLVLRSRNRLKIYKKNSQAGQRLYFIILIPGFWASTYIISLKEFKDIGTFGKAKLRVEIGQANKLRGFWFIKHNLKAKNQWYVNLFHSKITFLWAVSS